MANIIIAFGIGCLIGLIGMTLQGFIYEHDLNEISKYHIARETSLEKVIQKYKEKSSKNIEI